MDCRRVGWNFTSGLVDQFQRHGLRVIAPKAEHSWWVDRICERFDPQITGERFVLDHVVPFVAEHWQCEPPRLALLGPSMGGQGVLRLAYKYPNSISRHGGCFSRDRFSNPH